MILLRRWESNFNRTDPSGLSILSIWFYIVSSLYSFFHISFNQVVWMLFKFIKCWASMLYSQCFTVRNTLSQWVKMCQFCIQIILVFNWFFVKRCLQMIFIISVIILDNKMCLKIQFYQIFEIKFYAMVSLLISLMKDLSWLSYFVYTMNYCW